MSRKDKHGGEKTDMVDMAQDMVQKLKKENKQAGDGGCLMRTWETLSGCIVGIHHHPQAATNFGGPSRDGNRRRRRHRQESLAGSLATELLSSWYRKKQGR